MGQRGSKTFQKKNDGDQIEHASCVLLEAAKAFDHADLAEYRAGLEQWIKEHSPANPESEPMTPDKAASPEEAKKSCSWHAIFQ